MQADTEIDELNRREDEEAADLVGQDDENVWDDYIELLIELGF